MIVSQQPKTLCLRQAATSLSTAGMVASDLLRCVHDHTVQRSLGADVRWRLCWRAASVAQSRVR